MYIDEVYSHLGVNVTCIQIVPNCSQVSGQEDLVDACVLVEGMVHPSRNV